MSRRTERRRAALLDALANGEPATERELATRLGRRVLPVMLDLFRLEDAGSVTAETVAVEGGYRIAYRVAGANGAAPRAEQ